ncbi:MAG: C_GCAxxG_C_C family protein [Oscillibacter sp.]|nr:C_GCAxxG_C_C family protein [Oscillibacter sp.]
MEHMEKARELRASTDIHYNCAQSVLVTFAKEMGLTEQQAYDLGAHFGSGMRHGSTCGVLTGGLMVLGMVGKDGKNATDLLTKMRQEHGALDCAELLKASKEQGLDKKAHCDGLVYEMVQTLEGILK